MPASFGDHPAVRNIKTSLTLAVVLPIVVLTGCARSTPNPNLPVGKAAYDVIPSDFTPGPNYLIRPLDTISVRVFREADLSTDAALVDETGKVQMPLIGSVDSAGKTTTELGQLLAKQLGERYLVSPEVTVSVKQMAPRYATVEGEVKQPGTYEIQSNTTLLSLLAQAHSPTATAKLNETVVFRTVNNQRLVARFDLKQIRTGLSPDPHIIEGDLVMVGYSGTKGLLEGVLRTTPLLNVWARYTL